MKKKVTLIGSLPNPIGGISSYCKRLLTSDLSFHYAVMVDLYSGLDKYNIPIKVFRPKFYNKIYKAIWIFFIISFKTTNVLHFNFSGVKGSLIALICLKRRKSWVLTLHNGSLKLPSGIIGFLCSHALGRFDKILVISQKQYDFMQRMGLSHKCIFVDSYIPLKNELNLSIKNKTRVTRFIENYDKCLLGSGYGKKIYCFDYLVDFSRDNPSVGLIIVLYGEFEKDVINFLKESALQLDNLILLDSLEESEFNSLLQHIDIYVRPNSVDSFGIACADAIMFGKLVVASDVCKRFEGVNTFKTNDYDDFVRVLNSALLSTHSKLTELDPELLIQEKISVYNKAYK